MMRWMPLVLVGLFIGVGFGWRAWLQKRRFGHSGIVMFRSGRVDQHVRELALVGLVAILTVQAVGAASGRGPIGPVLPLADSSAVAALGVLLSLVGIVLMVRAQLDMGASWRVGVDEQARPGLVTGGLYRVSRNPIYLALFVALAGFTLVMPTWLSLLALIGAVVGVGRQVREEEAYLRRAYGTDFERYAARVGRFLPGIGRLAP
ncbi:MAG: isoprenylcysteine carboxylmethyltransferase family protein [Deltaproteobacteria bacterium]|nr:isoprenylcysteine carboxylmethyltransferase family protein [Deltaproteobacteria bacterium]